MSERFEMLGDAGCREEFNAGVDLYAACGLDLANLRNAIGMHRAAS